MKSSVGPSFFSERRGISRALVLVAAGLVAACSQLGPPPTLFVLGRPVPATPVAVSQADLAIVEVKAVHIPSYLDTTDLIVRDNDRVIASGTGRWAERLSIGITRALTQGLASRLPDMRVTAISPVAQPKRQVLVDVTSFEATAGGQVVLDVQWTVADGAARQALLSNQLRLTVPVAKGGDGAVVEAMSKAVDDLAEHIARGITAVERR